MAIECVENQPNFQDGTRPVPQGELIRYEITSNGEVNHHFGDYENLMRQLGQTSLQGFERIYAPEVDPFIEMGDLMKKNVIGQDDAVDAVVDALGKIELRDTNRPVASFLFMGPTGVGKTELTKEFNRVLHVQDHMPMLRIDCSDYARAGATTRLVGAPPMFVGREQKPELRKENVAGENKFIVFDEIEKADPELQKLLLQILEEGELKLNDGKVTSFRDTIIVMTSNVGADRMRHELSNNRIGFRQGDTVKADKETLQSVVMASAKETFLPEFLNRIDSKVVFQPHTDDQLVEVLEHHIGRLNERFFQKGLRLTVSEDLRRAFVENADDRREYGARHIVREFEKDVVARLSKYVQLGSIKRGSHVYAYLDESLQEETEKGRVPYNFVSRIDEDVDRAYKNLQKKAEYEAERTRRELEVTDENAQRVRVVKAAAERIAKKLLEDEKRKGQPQPPKSPQPDEDE